MPAHAVAGGRQARHRPTGNGIQEPLPVKADRIHIQQVLLSLAMNGMDAMSDGTAEDRTITIRRALARGSQVEVSVSDSGTGIPGDKLSQVFDTFYTTKEEGTGLGQQYVAVPLPEPLSTSTYCCLRETLERAAEKY